MTNSPGGLAEICARGLDPFCSEPGGVVSLSCGALTWIWPTWLQSRAWRRPREPRWSSDDGRCGPCATGARATGLRGDTTLNTFPALTLAQHPLGAANELRAGPLLGA